MSEKLYDFREYDSKAARDYELRGTELTVRGPSGYRTRFETKFDLSQIAITPEISRYRHPAFRRGVTITVWVVSIALLLRSISFIPVWLWMPFVLFGLSIGLILIYRYVWPIDFTRFKFHTGAVAFDLGRYRKSAREFDTFVAALSSAIERAQRKELNQPPQPTPDGSAVRRG